MTSSGARESDLTRVRRLPEKALTDRESLDAVLDAGFVAHIGIMDSDIPVVIPVGYARKGNELLIHGSSASRLFTVLAAGSQAAVTVTLTDGMVLARSLFESSMNYRSAMLFGVFREVTGTEEIEALKAITDHLLPGRWDHARQPTTQELKATRTLAMEIDRWSVKVGAGDPDDNPDDLSTESGSALWAGVVPLVSTWGTPIPDPRVPAGAEVPEYITSWKPPYS